MTSLVFAHLMNGIVDSIQIQFLSTNSQLLLAFGCTKFSIYTHGQVLLSAIGKYLA